MRSAPIYLLSSESNARARSSFLHFVVPSALGRRECRWSWRSLLVSCLRPALVPMCVAPSMVTAVRPRPRPTAHASMPRASATCAHGMHPCSCAGALSFESFTIGSYRTLPDIVDDAHNARGAAEAAWSTWRLSLRGLNVLGGRAGGMEAAPVCERSRWWPVAACGSAVAHGGRHQCCGRSGSHFGP